MRLLLVLKGAHEIASLSSFFWIKPKEQNQNQFRNLTSFGNIPQHIRIISCLFLVRNRAMPMANNY
jgi:hypothetical protein